MFIVSKRLVMSLDCGHGITPDFKMFKLWISIYCVFYSSSTMYSVCHCLKIKYIFHPGTNTVHHCRLSVFTGCLSLEE